MEINIYILIPVKSSTVIPLVCIPSNVEWYSTPIGCWHLSYNTKDLCRRLSFDNSFLDQPVHQTCVYVVFGNPSADIVLPFLSRLQSQSIFYQQDHSFECIPMGVSLQEGRTKRIKNAISIQKKISLETKRHVSCWILFDWL